MPLRVLDSYSAMYRVSQDVWHDNGPPTTDSPVLYEFRRKNECRLFEVRCVEGAELGRRDEFTEVRTLRGLKFHPCQDPCAHAGQRIAALQGTGRAPPAGASGTRHGGTEIVFFEFHGRHGLNLTFVNPAGSAEEVR